MPRSTRALTLSGAALLAAALVLGTAGPAAAHTDDLFTLGEDAGTGDIGFVSVSKADAAMSWLGASAPTNLAEFILGAEIVEEQGYAIHLSDTWRLVTWNHGTGQFGTSTAITLDPGSLTYGDEYINELGGLDALPDGTLLTRIMVNSSIGQSSVVSIASLDPDTAVATRLLDLPVLPMPDSYYDLATDPTTGITYLFYHHHDGGPGYASAFPADLADLTLGAPVELTGVSSMFGSTRPLGADFDEHGVLWLVVDVAATERFQLLSFAPGFTAAAAATDIGELPQQDADPMFDSTITLAVDPAAAPAGLPDTGHEFGGALLAAGLFWLAGVAVFVLTRRRTA